jgi:ABC-type uncharacterized transport system substrate-binding protein
MFGCSNADAWTKRAAAAAAVGFLAAAQPAQAHPHVFVTYQTTINYANAMVTGVQHAWTFDDMYTAMAVQGLDKNGDGKYDRAELAELAKVNMDGLREYGFFTFAKLAAADLKFGEPKDAWLEHKNGILTLHFALPLDKPVFADAAGLTFSIYDPSYFIAFEPEKTDAIKLASAPAGCTAAFGEADPAAAAQLKQLGDSLAQEMAGATTYDLGAPKTVAVNCKKSS